MVALSSENTLRFQTYLNYVSAISSYLGEDKERIADHYRDVLSSNRFRGIQSGRCNEIGQREVGRFLRNAWLTEVHVRETNLNDEFIALSNHWAPVQLYYSVFLAIRAFFIAAGRNVGETHTKTLHVITGEIFSRPELFPYPWRILAYGDPEDWRFHNIPSGIVVKAVSPLSSNANTDFWSRYCHFLKTTRQRDCEARCDEWRRTNKKKRILRAQRDALIAQIGTTSFFECLYRMRVRSNYHDADAFLLSASALEDDILFHHSLTNINWHVLLCLELLIAKCLGKKKYEEIVASYEKSNIPTEPYEATVGQRWAFISPHL